MTQVITKIGAVIQNDQLQLLVVKKKSLGVIHTLFQAGARRVLRQRKRLCAENCWRSSG